MTSPRKHCPSVARGNARMEISRLGARRPSRSGGALGARPGECPSPSGRSPRPAINRLLAREKFQVEPAVLGQARGPKLFQPPNGASTSAPEVDWLILSMPASASSRNAAHDIGSRGEAKRRQVPGAHRSSGRWREGNRAPSARPGPVQNSLPARSRCRDPRRRGWWAGRTAPACRAAREGVSPSGRIGGAHCFRRPLDERGDAVAMLHARPSGRCRSRGLKGRPN